MSEFSTLSVEQQEKIISPFDDVIKQISDQQLIAVIRDKSRIFEESEYNRLLSQLSDWTTTPPSSDKTRELSHANNGTFTTIELRIEYVPSKSIRVAFEKAWLADETDVDNYLKSMREALLAEIQKGKRIQL
jgi:hypothetical protein